MLKDSKKENASAEAAGGAKKSRKVILIVSITLSVLVMAGVAVALINLFKEEPAPEVIDQPGSELYWNADREEYMPKLGGITMRKPEADGLYTVRFMVKGDFVEYRVKDRDLMIEIDNKAIMGLAIDENGFITDMLDFDEIGVREVAKSCYVQDVDGNAVNVNTSLSGEGVDYSLNLKDEVDIWNVTSRDKLGTTTHLQTLDCIRVFSKEDVGITDVFVISREDELTGVSVEKYCEHCKQVVKWQMWIGETGLPTKDGHWRLVRDVNMKGQHSMAKGASLILDLNGKTITATHKSRIIALFNEDCYLALMDLSDEQTGTLKGLGNGGHGGLVWVRYNGVCDFYSGTLDGSEIVASGGNGTSVAVQNPEGTFNMYGGTIIGGISEADVVKDEKTGEEQFAGGNGGSVNVFGTFNMYDGVIRDGMVSSKKNSNGAVMEVRGGNVSVFGGGTFNMYGGTISGGKLSEETLSHGGNVYLLRGSTFNMYGGTIKDGRATAQGGNVYGFASTFNMSGGEIINGKNRVNGEYDYAHSSNLFFINGTFNMTGGLIEGYAYARDYGTDADGKPIEADIKISGTAQIKGGIRNLTLDLGKTVDFGKLEEGAEIYVSGTGYISKDTESSNQDYVHSDMKGVGVRYNDKKLFVGRFGCVCGKNHVTDDGKTVKEHFGACDGEELVWFAWGDKANLPTSSGNWYLVTDVSLNRQFNIAKDAVIALDLNGHTVNGSESKRVLSLYAGNVKMTLTDRSSELDGRIVAKGSGDGIGYGNCIWVAKGSSLVMYGGHLDAAKVHSTVDGVAVDVQQGSSFTMYGGTITGGTSDTYAGAVSTKGRFDMWGGTVQDGCAKKDGGNVFVGQGGTLNLYGGVIRRGKAETSGGNILGRNINIAGGSVVDGEAMVGGNVCCSVELKMSGGLLARGKADHGGNVYLTMNSKFAMSGGTIKEGSAQAGTGGNIRSIPRVKIEITGGKIENGKAKTDGGNIWMNGGSIKVEGGSITGGRALAGNGGNICTVMVNQGGVTESTVIELRGGSVSDGRAAVKGGNAYIVNGDLTLAGNIAVKNGIATDAGSPSNMHLAKGVVAKLDGLSGDAGSIGITCEDAVFASNAKADRSDLSRFVIDDGFDVIQSEERNLMIGKIGCMCGGHRDDGTNANDGHEDWCTAELRNIEWRAWKAGDTLPDEPGYYYLTEDIRQARQITLSKEGNYGLDLNGHSITKTNASSRLCVFWNTNNDITLNITDTSAERGGSLRLQDGLEFEYDGFIVWFRYFEGECKHTLNLYAGTLNGENLKGDTVFVDTGVLSVFGGTIEGKVKLSAKYGSKLNLSGSPKVAVAVSDNESQDHGLNWTGTLELACDNVAEDAEIIIPDIGNLILSGTGEASAFKVLSQQHNGILDDNADGIGNLGVAAVMCSCGKIGEHEHEGGCSVPDKLWTAWPAGSILPSDSGAYYLTGDVRLNNFANLSGKKITLDLAGHTIFGKDGDFTTVRTGDGGVLNITDSVGGGAILCQGSYSGYSLGRVIDLWAHNSGSTVNFYGGTIGAAEGATGDNGTVSVGYGSFNMYGGTILPIEGAADGNSNAVSLANPANANFYGYLTVYGGTIKGEVLMRAAKARINIHNDAKVGISDESGRSYGIKALVTGLSVNCTDVTGEVVLKNSDQLGVSGTGEGSAFTVLWGHNRPSDDNDSGIGTLSMGAALMCTCGKIGEHEHRDCAVPSSPWVAWDGSQSANAPYGGNWYLTKDFTYTNTKIIGESGTEIHIDLAGHKLVVNAAASVYRFSNCNSVRLTIADSDSEKRGEFGSVYNGASSSPGAAVYMHTGNYHVVRVYDTKLVARNASLAPSLDPSAIYDFALVVHRNFGDFYMYGGSIEGNPSSGAPTIATRKDLDGGDRWAGIHLSGVEVDGTEMTVNVD